MTNSAQWIAFSVRLRTMCWGGVRPGELLLALAKDVRLPSLELLENLNVAVIRIGLPKNRSYVGREQVAIVRNAGAVQWLRWYLSNTTAT